METSKQKALFSWTAAHINPAAKDSTGHSLALVTATAAACPPLSSEIRKLGWESSVPGHSQNNTTKETLVNFTNAGCVCMTVLYGKFIAAII